MRIRTGLIWVAAGVSVIAICAIILLNQEEDPVPERVADRNQIVRPRTSQRPAAPPGEERRTAPKRQPRITARRFSEEGDSLLSRDPFVSKALLNYFMATFGEEWARHRGKDPLPAELHDAQKRFSELLRSLPRTLAKEEASAANQADAAAEARSQADDIDLIKAVANGSWEVSKADLEGDLLDRALEQRNVGETVSAKFFKKGKGKLKPGMVISIGPGLSVIDSRYLRASRREGFPPDVTIKGAGMNTSLLQMGDLGGRSPIRRLRIEDLTLDCSNNFLFDLRSDPLSLRLSRVRIVRFDMGAGGSLIFGVRHGGIIVANRCEFLGGYGRSPGSGNFWRGGPWIARFSHCRFSRLILDPRYIGAKGRALLASCRFDEMLRDPTIKAPTNLSFDSPLVGPLITAEAYRKRPPKSLGEFFPVLFPRRR